MTVVVSAATNTAAHLSASTARRKWTRKKPTAAFRTLSLGSTSCHASARRFTGSFGGESLRGSRGRLRDEQRHVGRSVQNDLSRDGVLREDDTVAAIALRRCGRASASSARTSLGDPMMWRCQTPIMDGDQYVRAAQRLVEAVVPPADAVVTQKNTKNTKNTKIAKDAQPRVGPDGIS